MLTLSIGGIDRTSFVAIESLRIENILTQQVDRCSFKTRSFGTKSFKPAIGKVIIVTNNGTTIFGGVIIKVTEESIANNIVEYSVECSDYTRILDQHLVAKVYQHMTINAIIADIVLNFCPAGITATQVDAAVSVDYIQFKYEPVSTCLKQLADVVGYDWYIDYSQDIYFKQPTATSAPIDITDDGGVYEMDSLSIRRDNSQMRNSIVVRGGEYLGTEFTASVKADGKQIIFNLPYRYENLKATLTGHPLSLGIDYIDDANNFDALYNFQEKLLRFKDTDKPSLNATLSFGGKPYLPVIVRVKDQSSIDAIFSAEGVGDGKYEYLVIDKSINSKQGARDRALAEIRTYGETLSEGDFVSETDGLRAGMRIRINSVSRNMDEYFIINKVVSSVKDSSHLIYQVSLITTKTMDFISVLKKILLRENKSIDINDDEVLDLVEADNEVIQITDSVAQASTHEQDETITLSEVFTNNGINYGIQFVLAPQSPTSTKRVFILNGSRMS